jgi:hypothetical protein
MIFIDKERSHLVKAWESATSKSGAVNSIAFIPNADYFIAAKAGKLPDFFY